MGGWLTPPPGRCRPPGNDPVPIAQEAGWAPGPFGWVRKISPPPGFDFRTVKPVASYIIADWYFLGFGFVHIFGIGWLATTFRNSLSVPSSKVNCNKEYQDTRGFTVISHYETRVFSRSVSLQLTVEDVTDRVPKRHRQPTSATHTHPHTVGKPKNQKMKAWRQDTVTR